MNLFLVLDFCNFLLQLLSSKRALGLRLKLHALALYTFDVAWNLAWLILNLLDKALEILPEAFLHIFEMPNLQNIVLC